MAEKTYPRVSHYLRVALLAFVVLIVAVGLGAVPVNLFFAKTTISKVVLENLGAELDIRGSVWMRFGFRPVLSASEITLSAAGQTHRPLAQIDSLTIKPRLLDVLRGDMHLRGLEASGITFDYCPEQIFKPESASVESGLPSIAVDTLRLTRIRPQCAHPERRLDFLPPELDLAASIPSGKPLKVEIEGRDSPETFTLTATGESLSSLLTDPIAYPLALQLSAFGSELSVHGTVSRPLSEPGLEAEIELVAKHPAALWDAAGIRLPATGALEIKAQILASADEIRLDKLEATLGEQQLRLSGLARGFLSRPYFEVNAQLNQLDFEPLRTGLEQDAGNRNQQAPDFQSLFDVLAQFDARARLSIDRLLNADLPANGLMIDAGLEKGLLSVDRAELLLAGSPVILQAVLDLRPDCAQLTSKIKVSDVDLARLGRLLDLDSSIGGQLERATVSSRSCGGTLDEHIHSLSLDTAFSGLRPRLGDSDLPLVLNSMKAGIGWNEPGHLSAEGLLLGEAVSAKIDFGSVDALLAGANWPLVFTASGAESRLDLSGDAALNAGTMNLDANLDLSVNRFGALHAWIGANPVSQLALSARTRLQLHDNGLVIDGLDITLGHSNLRGSLSWAGPRSALPISLKIQSDRLNIAELTTLFAQVDQQEQTGQQAQENQQARSGFQPELDWINGRFKLPPIDIDLTLRQIEGIKFELSQLRLRGRLRERLIEDGRLEILFENIGIEGVFEADFHEKPWNISYEFGANNIDIGRLLSRMSIAEDVDLRADRMDFRYVSEGQSIRDLAVNSRLDVAISSLYWFAEPATGGGSYEFHLSELALSAAPQSPTILRSSGFLNGEPIEAWMRTPSLPVTFNSDADLPLSLVLGIGDEVVMLQSVLDRKVKDGGRAELTISGQQMNPAEVVFSELKSPLGDYEFGVNVMKNEDELLFSDLQARIGTSRVSGHANILAGNSRRRFDIQLNSPFLETEDLVVWVKKFRSGSGQKPVGEAPENDLFAMLSQQINDLAESNTFAIKIEIEELRSAGTLLGKAKLGLMVDDNEIRLDPLQIALPDGVVDARYFSRQLEDGVDAELSVRVDHLNYGGLLRLLDPESEARGYAYLETALASRAPDASQLLNHLKGQFDLVLVPENIDAGFLNLWVSNLVFALLPTRSDDSKKLNCLVASFNVEDGVMKTKNTLLDSTDVIVRSRGSIDLASRKLDLLVIPQAKRERFFSASTPIEVTGPFSDFKIGVASGGFMTTMLRWYTNLIYVPYKWLTGERFPSDGMATCFNAVDLGLPATE